MQRQLTGHCLAKRPHRPLHPEQVARECDFCGNHASMTGELRMVLDEARGGAAFPICLDCHDSLTARTSGHPEPWSSIATVDEWLAHSTHASRPAPRHP